MLDPKSAQDAAREQKNEQLRQVGLAQGMVEFGRSFSDGKSVSTVETEKSRIILHELEPGWWILAVSRDVYHPEICLIADNTYQSINLTILPGTIKTPATKGKAAGEQRTIEYSSREVKPPVLLLGDLLQAHSIFLLHHASSLSALFARTKRSKFMTTLGRYWDMFLSTWNVLMHGNPANSLYGGIKIAACGELGMGAGEAGEGARGRGEREVLEGFVGRVDGLVDMIVSKFGDGGLSPESETNAGKDTQPRTKPTEPWLGSGDDPAAEDGAIFLGTGALSRKSLRDVSHWVEDLYRWGPHAYGVMDNTTAHRRNRKSRGTLRTRQKELSPAAQEDSGREHEVSLRNGAPRRPSTLRQGSTRTVSPTPTGEGDPPGEHKTKESRPDPVQRQSSQTNTDSDSNKSSTFVQYLKFGYGTHWSVSGTSSKDKPPGEPPAAERNPPIVADVSAKDAASNGLANVDGTSEKPMDVRDDSAGHYLIGLMGDIEGEVEEDLPNADADIHTLFGNNDSYNSRLHLRTLTVELEREKIARDGKAELSADLGNTDDDRVPPKTPGSEPIAESTASFEIEDRNKTKELQVVVYVNRPFIFVLLFELRTFALGLSSLYRSLHYQFGPLIKPLLAATSLQASKPDINSNDTGGPNNPIYDLVWDPELLTVTSTIPNIPDPYQSLSKSYQPSPWSRIEALNTHMQILNTYTATTDSIEMERTCKTSRGWWVVWTRVPGLEPKTPGHTDENGVDSPRASGLTSGASGLKSGPAHPFLETASNTPTGKEIFLIRRASDNVGARSSSIFASGSSGGRDTGWAAGPGRLAQGIGIDTKSYIESLLNLHR